MSKRIFLLVFLLCATCRFLNTIEAQAPTWTIDLLGKEKKPAQFQDRKLGSEKMAEKKFTFLRHFFQNNFTHYNYYYNTNNKIKIVIERAKEIQKDDYGVLLSFYPYSLENTASQKTELDSALLKSTAGILLHDLRNDWIDNMYLLMGKAFYFRKDFDSAAATFQFINYNLFPRKKNEDDDRIIGTSNASTKSRISIANNETTSLFKKITSLPPSRNDALIWMARTFIEQDELGESASLINTLQNDPNLPIRLKDDLEEVNAYWFYKQNIYDSTAVHLQKSLSNAESKQDRARSEFLLAQLYELTNQYNKASQFYSSVSAHTVLPLMDIYARLNKAKLLKGSNTNELNNSINQLLKMAKKDKFEKFRDILYYSAAELSLQKKDTIASIKYFNKSIHYNQSNLSHKNKAFLQLADIAYQQKIYKKAYEYYDSLQLTDTSIAVSLDIIKTKKSALAKIVEKIDIIDREDSLQTIAAMTSSDRMVLIKKIVKRLRKNQGLKEEADMGGTMMGFDNPIDNKKNEPIDLFSDGNKGEWYFYNSSLKSKGLADFKRKWGTRKNSDNWRRKNAVETPVNNLNQSFTNNTNPNDIDKAADPSLSTESANKNPNDTSLQKEISFESLLANIPLTVESMNSSNKLLAKSLFELAQLYQQDLEDYEQAIIEYEHSLKRYPDSLYDGELYLGLSFCYSKLGKKDKAAEYKKLLSQNFVGSHSEILLNNPTTLTSKSKNTEGTNKYNTIYNLFIEGKFEEALSEKKKADSIYGNNLWTPQLLYIEAVFYIKQRKDSIAIDLLGKINTLYPLSNIAQKTATMIDVLKRRTSIEEYLSKLEITRVPDNLSENNIGPIDSTKNNKNLIPSTPNSKDSSNQKTSIGGLSKDIVNLSVQPARDSIDKATIPSSKYLFNGDATHKVIMILNKVDGTYINESKNSLDRYVRSNFPNQQIALTKDAIDKDNIIFLFSDFNNIQTSYEFLLKIKKVTFEELSWLPINKYSFYPISEENLVVLKTKKDIAEYISWLKKNYPFKL
ncbi:MAG: tetratricopeptide repeat protein [Chitinophagia bacterium]|nr:tetratricopeptide repeat protein [Chitinophagia bacterium]